MRDMFANAGSQNEGLNFLKAWLATSLAFGIFISRGQVFTVGFAFPFFDTAFLFNLLIAGITCGLGFVLHELAHRVVARYYRAEAHFLASPDPMLYIPILVAFFGLFLAAPGAVWHRGHLTKEQIGHVAVAGPMTNLGLSLLFFGFWLATPMLGLSFFWQSLAYIGYSINAWLGLFNMIPVDPFDGGKVIRWSPLVFGITVGAALLMVFVLPNVI